MAARRSSYHSVNESALPRRREDVKVLVPGGVGIFGSHVVERLIDDEYDVHSVNVSVLPRREDMKVLVTGGVGFVGSHVVERLIDDEYDVTVFDLFNSETSSTKEKGTTKGYLEKRFKERSSKKGKLQFIKGNLCEYDSIYGAVEDNAITDVIHVAGLVDDRRSVNFPMEYIDVNIKGVVNLLKSCGELGVEHVVMTSTRSCFGEVDNNDVWMSESARRFPINPYGATKVASDAFGHVYHSIYPEMNVSILRIFASYGPRGRPDMIPRITTEYVHHDKPIRKFGDGSATRTWIYISDIVEAYLILMNNLPEGGFDEYNTGTSVSTTLNEMIETAEKVVGKKAIIKHEEVPKGDAHFVGSSNFSKIKEKFGWEPKVDLEMGLRLTYQYYLDEVVNDEITEFVEEKKTAE